MMSVLAPKNKINCAMEQPFIDYALATFQQKFRLQRYADNSIKTTELYTHITDVSKSNIKSSLDRL